MKTTPKLERAMSYWKAEQAGDLPGVLSHFAENATFTAPGFDLNGVAEISQFYEKIMGAYATMRIEVRRTVEAGDDLVVEFGFHYTRHSGESGYAEGCNVFTIQDGHFQRVRAYFNPSDY